MSSKIDLNSVMSEYSAAIGVFRHMSMAELRVMSRVCSCWQDTLGLQKEISSRAKFWDQFDIQVLFPSVKIINAKVWQDFLIDCGGLEWFKISVQGTPEFKNFSAIPVLMKLCAPRVIKGNAGVTILTIPQNLTFNILKQIGAVKEIPFDSMHNNAGPLENQYCPKAYNMVITNDVLSDTPSPDKSKSILDKVTVVKQFGFELPNLLEVATLAVLTFNKGNYSFIDQFTICRDSVDQLPVVFDSNDEKIAVHIREHLGAAYAGTAASMRL